MTEQNSNLKKSVLIGAIVFAIAFLAFVLISGLSALLSWIGGILMIFRPILIGLVLAYLLNPFFRFFEKKLFRGLRLFALKRTLSLICSILLLFLILALLLWLILPQLIDSIVLFSKNYQQYISSGVHRINLFLESVNEVLYAVTDNPGVIDYFNEAVINEYLANAITPDSLLGTLSTLDFKPLAAILGNTFSGIVDAFLGLFLTVYLLVSKEKRYAQIMKVRRAMLSDRANEIITNACTVADRSLGGFIKGRLIDSAIVAVLIYLALLVFNIPYALLIAVFIGITNIIPIMGILIGTIPTALIVLLTDPDKIIPFLVAVFVIQHIDNNIISPKILGDNIGISSLCVLIAITISGSMWGLWGMLLGVPLFALVLALLEEQTVSRLRKKGLPSGVESYYAANILVDPEQNASPTVNQSAQHISHVALRATAKQERGEKISFAERIALIVYKLAHKLRVFNAVSDKAIITAATEDALKKAEAEARVYVAEHTESDLSDHPKA